MSIRKALAVAAATAGVALALQGAPPASAHESCNGVNNNNASDLSPSSQKAWSAFLCGGGNLVGGAGKMVSGAWFGAPGIVVAAGGGELSATQMKAWQNWDNGARRGGRGAAQLVSGAYVGAPGIVLDQIKKGAAPTDMSARELRQVSFLFPLDSPILGELPLELPEIPGLPELPLPTVPMGLGGMAVS